MSLRGISVAAVAGLCIAACSQAGDANLWARDFARDRKPGTAITASDVIGYWEGDIAMGRIRTKIEPGRITLALRCDSEGKILSQGSAAIAFKKDEPAKKMILQEDLAGGSVDWCGFRFYKGNEFGYSLSEGRLKVSFAGASVSELRKLADSETTR